MRRVKLTKKKHRKLDAALTKLEALAVTTTKHIQKRMHQSKITKKNTQQEKEVVYRRKIAAAKKYYDPFFEIMFSG